MTTTAGPDASVTDGAPFPPDASVSSPDAAPADWLPDCNLSSITDPSELPVPIAWRTCDAPVSFPCEQMAANWPNAPVKDQSIPACDRADVAADGRVTLFIRRFLGGDDFYDMIAEADGAVRQVFYGESAASGRCYISEGDLHDGRYAFTITSRSGGTERCGLIAGDIGTAPTRGAFGDFVPHELILSCGTDVAVGAQGIATDVANGALFNRSGPFPEATLLDWSFKNLGPAQFWVRRWIGGEIFGGQMADEPMTVATAGKSPTLSYKPTDPTRKVTGADTDGTNIAWVESNVFDNDVNVYCSKPDVLMSASYGSSAGSFAPRSVLTLGPCGDVTEPRVGCGYAAFEGNLPGTRKLSVFIVRLADGRWWPLPYYGDATNVIDLSSVAAVSCSHVYVRAYSSVSGYTVVRIPLAQLGPGNPP